RSEDRGQLRRRHQSGRGRRYCPAFGTSTRDSANRRERYLGSRRVFFNRQAISKRSRLARAAGGLARGVIAYRILPRSASANSFADASTHAGWEYHWYHRNHSMAKFGTIREGKEIPSAARGGEPPQ